MLAGDENFSDQSIIGASDKEVQEQLDGFWMHENADLAGMRKADVDKVNAFASRQVSLSRAAIALRSSCLVAPGADRRIYPRTGTPSIVTRPVGGRSHPRCFMALDRRWPWAEVCWATGIPRTDTSTVALATRSKPLIRKTSD